MIFHQVSERIAHEEDWEVFFIGSVSLLSVVHHILESFFKQIILKVFLSVPSQVYTI